MDFGQAEPEPPCLGNEAEQAYVFGGVDPVAGVCSRDCSQQTPGLVEQNGLRCEVGASRRLAHGELHLVDLLDLDPGAISTVTVPVRGSMNPGGTTLFDHRIDRRVVIKLLGASAALAGLTGGAPALAGEGASSGRPGRQREDLLLTASRLFDGRRMLTDTAVFIRDGKIAAVGP